MRRVWAQTRKEITQILRDRLALALILILPIFQIMLMGSSLALIVHDLPIIVQDLDNSSQSRELIDAFRGSLTFRIVAWPTDRSPEAAFANNTARGALVIPRGFGRDLLRGVDTPVQMLVDGSDANTAKLIGGYAGGVTRAFNLAHRPASSSQPQVRTAIRFWYNPGLSSKRFYGPGVFVMAISMFPPLLATLAMAREGERKTILQVYVSSISAHEFLLGKIFAFMVVAFAESLLLLVFLFTFFGAQLAGDPTPFLVATVLYAFCVASFGVMIGAAIPNQAAAMQAVMLGGFLLVFMLSGLVFPLANVPGGLRWLSNLVWSRYYIEIVRDALLQGGGWPATWFKVLAIAGIGGLFYTAAWRRMRRMQLEV
jgi:drug efflux transport system permease protein